MMINPRILKLAALTLVSVFAVTAHATGVRTVLDCKSSGGESVALIWFQRATTIAGQKEFIGINASVDGIGYGSSIYFDLVDRAVSKNQLELEVKGQEMILKSENFNIVFAHNAFPQKPDDSISTQIHLEANLVQNRGGSRSVKISSLLNCVARGREKRN